MQKITSSALACALLLGALPAHATKWLVIGGGLALQSPTNPAGTTRLEVPTLHLQTLFFSFTVDDSVAGIDRGPIGGFGQSRSYLGAVSDFTLLIGSSATSFAPGGSSQIFIINNGRGGPPTSRLDQLTMSTGVVFNSGVPTFPLQTDAILPANGYFSSFSFGRSQLGTDIAPPQMLQSVDFPALDQIWTSAPPVFLAFQIRAGRPTDIASQQALPVAFFNATNLNFQLYQLPAVVPEPATWALLIAGFGMVGGTLRRRRAVHA